MTLWTRKIKINDRIEFGLDFVLKTDETVHDYRLQSVIIHDGSCESGHYYSYIKTNQNMNKWYKFDDNIVTSSSIEEIFKVGYGGFGSSSAYLLFYLRK